MNPVIVRSLLRHDGVVVGLLVGVDDVVLLSGFFLFFLLLVVGVIDTVIFTYRFSLEELLRRIPLSHDVHLLQQRLLAHFDYLRLFKHPAHVVLDHDIPSVLLLWRGIPLDSKSYLLLSPIYLIGSVIVGIAFA